MNLALRSAFEVVSIASPAWVETVVDATVPPLSMIMTYCPDAAEAKGRTMVLEAPVMLVITTVVDGEMLKVAVASNGGPN